ncbi:MAG: exosortase, partial [Pseudomonadota bacterium]
MSQSVEAAPGGNFSLANKPWAIILAGLAAVIGFAYFNGIANLLKRWGEQQELSHGYFLPVIAGWMIWERRDALLQSRSTPETAGLIGVGVAAALLVLSELTVTSLMIFQHFALILLLASLALSLGGRGFLWLALVPIAFLVFMIPPPYWVITVLSWKFQFWSSQLGVWMIELFGIPVFLSGNVIDLGDYQLAVAEACSGLRYLFPFLSLGFLAAYLFKAPMWQRAVVFLSTIPITIVMNSFRIAVTGVLVQAYGTSHAEGMLHLFEGWVVFILCMVLLFVVIAVIARFSGNKNFGDLLALPEIEPVRKGGAWTQAAFRRNALIAMAIIGAAGVAVHTLGDDNLRIPERRDLDNIVREYPGWTSTIKEIDATILETLGSDDHIVTDLRSPDGEQFNLYIAYLNMQRDGHSWHSPRQ